jgi:hypothetical protein
MKGWDVGRLVVIAMVVIAFVQFKDLLGNGIALHWVSENISIGDVQIKSSRWETIPTKCTQVSSAAYSKEILAPHHGKELPTDPMCQKSKCPQNSFCFLGSCPCHPGYSGESCETKVDIAAANPWYTKNCPNLQKSFTVDIDAPLSEVGGEHSYKRNASTSSSGEACIPPAHPKRCAYLCYSHPTYGTAVVPKSLWLAAQRAEGNLWAQEGQWKQTSDANDRAQEHWKAFDQFTRIPSDAKLGRVIEVGAGPWTQFKGLLYVRPDLDAGVSAFTVWEPGAKR